MAQCPTHTEEPSIGSCQRCGVFGCQRCMIDYPQELCIECLSLLDLDFEGGSHCTECDSNLAVGFHSVHEMNLSFVNLVDVTSFFSKTYYPHTHGISWWKRFKRSFAHPFRVPYFKCHYCDLCELWVAYPRQRLTSREVNKMHREGAFDSDVCFECRGKVQVGFGNVQNSHTYWPVEKMSKWFAWPTQTFALADGFWQSIVASFKGPHGRYVPAQFCHNCSMLVLRPKLRVSRAEAKEFIKSLNL